MPYSTFYARLNHPPPSARRRRAEIDAAVAASFDASGGTYGSPRVLADLRAAGWRVSKKDRGGVDGPPGAAGAAAPAAAGA